MTNETCPNRDSDSLAQFGTRKPLAEWALRNPLAQFGLRKPLAMAALRNPQVDMGWRSPLVDHRTHVPAA